MKKKPREKTAVSAPALEGEGAVRRENFLARSKWSRREKALLGAFIGLSSFVALKALRIGRFASNTIRVSHSVAVSEPVENIYRFWRRFSNLPQFISHLSAVTELTESRSRWRASLGNIPIEWESELTRDIPNKEIAWRSVSDSFISHKGAVTFHQTKSGTIISLDLIYHPPAGAVGNALLRLFGEDPRAVIKSDLERFKTILKRDRRAEELELLSHGETVEH